MKMYAEKHRSDELKRRFDAVPNAVPILDVVSVSDAVTVSTTVLDAVTVPTIVLDAVTVPTIVLDAVTVPTIVLDAVTVPTTVLDAVTVPTIVLDAVTVPTIVLDAVTVPTIVLNAVTVPDVVIKKTVLTKRKVQINVKPKVKITIKTQKDVVAEKSDNNIRLMEYDWEYFNRDKHDYIHINNAKHIMKMMFGRGDKFYHAKMDTPESVEIFKQELQKISSYNTRVNYCNALCKFMELTVAEQYMAYTIIRDEENVVLKKHDSERTVIDFLDLLPIIIDVYSGKILPEPTIDTYKAVRVMCLLIKELLSGDQVNLIGVLRFADLRQAKFSDDGINNYIDVDDLTLNIRSGLTKNKKTRVIKINQEFIDGILNIYGTEKYPDRILYDDKMATLKNTRKISSDFKALIGETHTSVRASFTTYMAKTCKDVVMLRTICHNQGHKLSTALTNYRRKTVRKN
jgi:hypothetical protein